MSAAPTLLCPECLAPLVVDGGPLARCPSNGRRFRVLFQRPAARPVPPPVPIATASPAPALADAPPVAYASSTACANHLLVTASAVCSGCGDAICVHCDHPQPGERHLCPACSLGGRVPSGTTCAVHAGQPAVALCASCGAASCATCDFVFPGDVHVCPRCVEKPRTGLSDRRKKSLLYAYLLAGWSTVGLAVVASGMLAKAASTPEGSKAIGLLMTLFVLLPGAAGLAVGLGTLDRRLSNPPSVWGAAIWNGLIVGLFMLLVVIGIFSK